MPATCPAPPNNPTSISESIACVLQNIAGPGNLANFSAAVLLQKIIEWLLSLAAILALLALVAGGILYIISLGSEEQSKRAKRIILYAIIGLLVIFLSFAVLSAIQTLFTPAPVAPPPPAT